MIVFDFFVHYEYIIYKLNNIYNMKKPQAFSLSEEVIKKLNIISKILSLNKSVIVEKQIIKFISQVENGMYDGLEDISTTVKEQYNEEINT